MIFAAINWLSISINLLLVVFVIVCLLMALLILMQRPKQEGLGAAFGGGVTDQVFGARTTNVLQKGTVYLGSMFFVIALTLAILIGKQNQQETLLEPKKADTEQTAAGAAEEEVVAGEIPVDPTSLAEELPAEAVPEPPAGIPAEDAAEAAADAVEGIVEDVVEEPAAEEVTAPEAPAAEQPDAEDKPE
jgi:preprotein translocase subunit SecG